MRTTSARCSTNSRALRRLSTTAFSMPCSLWRGRRQEPSRRPEERHGVGGWTTFRHPLNAGEAVRLAGEEALKRILPGGSHSTTRTQDAAPAGAHPGRRAAPQHRTSPGRSSLLPTSRSGQCVTSSGLRDDDVHVCLAECLVEVRLRQGVGYQRGGVLQRTDVHESVSAELGGVS